MAGGLSMSMAAEMPLAVEMGASMDGRRVCAPMPGMAGVLAAEAGSL